MIVKMNKVPVVAIVHRGNYLHAPFWNFRQKRKVPLHTTMTLVLTKEDVESLSVAEINAKIKESLKYDDYKYQLENDIKITEPYRAEGMHKILYQCPHCLTESKMATKGATLWCEECGKRWTLNENGTLSAEDGETEFTHVPDWFEWERSQVRRQIEEGTYSFSDEVDVHSMPRCYKFESLGKATLTHDMENGFVLTGHYNGKDYKIQRLPLQTNSLHVEYDFPHIKPFDCVDISTENDSFYCFPTKPNVVTKLSLATEELYKIKLAETRKK
jgi:translation initiation factor IF-1